MPRRFHLVSSTEALVLATMTPETVPECWQPYRTNSTLRSSGHDVFRKDNDGWVNTTINIVALLQGGSRYRVATNGTICHRNLLCWWAPSRWKRSHVPGDCPRVLSSGFSDLLHNWITFNNTFVKLRRCFTGERCPQTGPSSVKWPEVASLWCGKSS